MMFINNKCFRKDMKVFINFFRKPLITMWELFYKLFIRKFMLDYTSR